MRSSLGAYRQPNREHRPATCQIASLHRPAVQLRYATHNGEPQARVTAPFTMTTALKKAFENVR